VGSESFAVLLGDDIMVDDANLLRRMLDVHHERNASVLAILRVPLDEISAYGCAVADPVADGVVRVRSLVEKPSPEEAPSDMAVIGRYVFTPDIFDALERIEPGAGGELQLTDAIELLAKEQPVYGCVFQDGRYDIGRKIDFLRANIELSLERPDVGPELADLLANLVRRRNLS
jgi:UTP--glucose-1-phosphate uridylyltransferase